MMALAVLLVPFILGAWWNINSYNSVPGLLSGLVVALCLCAYFFGRTSGRVSAIAQARATAVAVSKSAAIAQANNQIVINVADGARVQSAGAVGLEAAPWLQDSRPLLAVEDSPEHLEFLDGDVYNDYSEVAQQEEH